MSEDTNLLLLKEACVTVLEKYCIRYNVDEIRGLIRRADVVFCRRVLCHYFRHKGYNLTEIGKILGGISHCSVSHLLRNNGKKRDLDNRLELVVQQIKNDLFTEKMMIQIEFHREQIAKLEKMQEGSTMKEKVTKKIMEKPVVKISGKDIDEFLNPKK